MTTPDILCLGEPMVEFVREDAEGRSYRRGFGGDTSNFAIAAARQGASVGYITALGADRFGDALVDLWAGEGIDTAHVIRSDSAPTGIYFVDPDPEARQFTYYRAGSAASRYRPDDLPRAALAATQLLHVSGITLAVSETMREATFAAIEACGGAVSLDTNLRPALWPLDTARAVLDRAIAKSDTVVTSIDDCALLYGVEAPDRIIDAFQAQGPETVLVTLGAGGCRVASGDRRETVPAHPTKAIDSTGAGDSLAGSFHAWRLETGDAFEAARCAVIVAAGTVSGLGGIDPIPRRAAVLAAMAEAG